MTTAEFSNEFDVLYNNIMSNQAPGLNEYEKSVFLTKAQAELIQNHFNPNGNKYKEGFDSSSKRQIDFSELMRVVKNPTVNTTAIKVDDRGVMYTIPAELLLIINESATVTSGTETIKTQVIPISHIEYSRLMSKPYKEPLKYQSWRLISSSSNNVGSEVIPRSGYSISEYSLRYIKKPVPIILTNLTTSYGDVTIDGSTTVSECELNQIIHREILDRAVELAKAAYTGDIKSIVELNTRNE